MEWELVRHVHKVLSHQAIWRRIATKSYSSNNSLQKTKENIFISIKKFWFICFCNMCRCLGIQSVYKCTNMKRPSVENCLRFGVHKVEPHSALDALRQCYQCSCFAQYSPTNNLEILASICKFRFFFSLHLTHFVLCVCACAWLYVLFVLLDLFASARE